MYTIKCRNIVRYCRYVPTTCIKNTWTNLFISVNKIFTLKLAFIYLFFFICFIFPCHCHIWKSFAHFSSPYVRWDNLFYIFINKQEYNFFFFGFSFLINPVYLWWCTSIFDYLKMRKEKASEYKKQQNRIEHSI